MAATGYSQRKPFWNIQESSRRQLIESVLYGIVCVAVSQTRRNIVHDYDVCSPNIIKNTNVLFNIVTNALSVINVS